MIILNNTTTIQVPQKLKKELDCFKNHERETYAEIISGLINVVRADEEAKLELSEETLKCIKEAREDARKGNVFSSRQIKKELGF